MIKNKGAMLTGLFLSLTFLIVLVAMFSPVFKGTNALQAADTLFNSIAKGSTYYIPGLIKKNTPNMGKDFTATLRFSSEDFAGKASKILVASGAKATQEGQSLTVKGDLGKTLNAALRDSDAMFANNERAVQEQYDLSGKEASYVWWTSLKEIDKDLTRQKRFKDAAFVSEVVKKGVEVGYNFFGIVPQTASSRALPLTFSLIFYVVYTLWWGIAIMMLFNGFGLEMKAGVKKEV